MLSIRRSILLSPLFLLLAAVSLPAQGTTRTVTLTLLNTAHCDADVRITQDGRAVVSRAVVLQLATKTVSVEITDNTPLIVHVKGRDCNIGYKIDVPVYQGDAMTLEVGDKPETVVARK